MANSLYQQMNQMAQGTTQGMAQPNNMLMQHAQSVKRMANMLRGKSNPMQILQTVAQNDSGMAQVMNMVGNSGMSAKQFFMQTAQQQGMDPNQIISMLQ